MTMIKREAPEKITKLDVLKAWWRYKLVQMITISNTTKTATSYVYSLGPILKKLYKNEDDLKEALIDHNEFYMTRYDWGGCITGLVIAMEEKRANDLYEKGESEITRESISQTKLGLMGPFAAVGDTFENIVFFTPALVIGTPMAIAGNFWCLPIFFLLAVVPDWVIGTITYALGYEKGKDFVSNLLASNTFDRVLSIAGIIGMAMFGALTWQLVTFTTPGLLITGTSLTTHLDSIIPGITKLLPVFLCLYLFKKKKWPVVAIVIFLVVVCIILGVLGVFTASPEAAAAILRVLT